MGYLDYQLTEVGTIILILGVIALSVICGFMVKKKGRNWFLGFLLNLMISFVGTTIVVYLYDIVNIVNSGTIENTPDMSEEFCVILGLLVSATGLVIASLLQDKKSVEQK